MIARLRAGQSERLSAERGKRGVHDRAHTSETYSCMCLPENAIEIVLFDIFRHYDVVLFFKETLYEQRECGSTFGFLPLGRVRFRPLLRFGFLTLARFRFLLSFIFLFDLHCPVGGSHETLVAQHRFEVGCQCLARCLAK